MKKLVEFIRSINIRKILTVFMVGCLLAVSTACNQDTVGRTDMKTGSRSDATKSTMSSSYDQYDANQEYQGGMNGYNDDRRYDYDAGAAAKAKTLVDTAKRRQVDNVGDYVENVTDRAKSNVKQAKREVPRTLKENQENAVDYVQDRSQNLKRNLSKVPGGVKDVVEEATEPARDTLDDVNRATKNTARDIKGNFQDLS
jgi:gas vesicle protein